jgi:hypothetical protein
MGWFYHSEPISVLQNAATITTGTSPLSCYCCLCRDSQDRLLQMYPTRPAIQQPPPETMNKLCLRKVISVGLLEGL